MPMAVEILLRAFGAMALIIGFTRLFGLRSFSKLSSFDFAVTVALGSVLAGAVTAPDQSFWVPVFAIAALYIFQMALAPLRVRLGLVRQTVDNDAMLVMENGEIFYDSLEKVNMTKGDLIAKLRESNALRLDHVHAVVVEATGDVSVLHGPPETEIAPLLLEDVRRS